MNETRTWKYTRGVMLLFMGLVCLSGLGCTGCKERVLPGHVAKVLTVSGWKPETYKAGYVECWGRDKLVLLDVTTHRVKEHMSVKMADDLDFPFDIYVRMRMEDDSVEGMFDDIKPNWVTDSRATIEFESVYSTYGQMLIRNIARTVLTQYDVTDVKSNIKEITAQLNVDLVESFKTIPLAIEDVTLSGFQYPKVITDAYEIKAKREIEIHQIEAKKAKELASKEAEIAIASKQREVELIKANTMRDYNAIIGEGISESWVIYRHYEVMEQMATNGNAVFMPYEAYRPSNAGLHMQMFKSQEEASKE